jgi:hypothetical protein
MDVSNVVLALLKVGEFVNVTGKDVIATDHCVYLLDMGKLNGTINQDPKKSRIPNPPRFMVYLAEPFVGISKSCVATNIGNKFNVDN